MQTALARVCAIASVTGTRYGYAVTGTRYEIPKRRRRRAARCFGWRRAISWCAPGYGGTSCPHQRRDVGCDRAGGPGQSGEWPQSTPRPSKASAAKQSSPSANSKLRNSRTIPCAISRTRGPLSITRRLDCFAQARNDGGKVTTNSFTRLPCSTCGTGAPGRRRGCAARGRRIRAPRARARAALPRDGRRRRRGIASL